MDNGIPVKGNQEKRGDLKASTVLEVTGFQERRLVHNQLKKLCTSRGPVKWMGVQTKRARTGLHLSPQKSGGLKTRSALNRENPIGRGRKGRGYTVRLLKSAGEYETFYDRPRRERKNTIKGRSKKNLEVMRVAATTTA